MNTNTFLAIAAIVLAAIAVLSIKGCIDKKRPVPVSPTQPVIDTVNHLHEQTQREVDSLRGIITTLQGQRDQLKEDNERQSSQLSVKNVQINALSKEYSLYRKYKDTAQALNACDSLSEKVGELTAQVEAQQLTNRALQNTNDSLVGTSSLALARMEYENSVLKESFDKVSVGSLQYEKDIQKLQKKADKRFGIGPSAGATYLNGKIVPYGGIGLHWLIIKF